MTTPQENNRCDAVIFIPGLGEFIDQSIDGIAQHISTSLKYETSEQAQFHSEILEYNPEDTTTSTENSAPSKTRMIRISVKEPTSVDTTVDVYKLSYNSDFTYNYSNSSFLYKIFRLFILLIYGIPVLISSFFSKNSAKNPLEKFQLLFGTLLFFVFVAYMGILLIAVFNTLGISNIAGPQGIIVFLALLESLRPNIRQLSEKIIVNYICSLEYLSFGEKRNVISRQLTNLLKFLEKKGIYQHIYIVSYSFGTIIALDNLFPPKFNGLSNKRPHKRPQAVNTLVTIGCPFDIIRTFWQNYFNQRQMLQEETIKWINLYNPIDVLSSNFRNNEELKEAQVGIILADSDIIVKPNENIVCTSSVNTMEKLSLFRLLFLLLGIWSHFTYWGKKYENEENCFSILIPFIFKKS